MSIENNTKQINNQEEGESIVKDAVNLSSREKSFLTVEEVAERMSVSKAWLYRQAKAGKVPHIRFGSVIRFSLDDINRWVTEHKQGMARS